MTDRTTVRRSATVAVTLLFTVALAVATAGTASATPDPPKVMRYEGCSSRSLILEVGLYDDRPGEGRIDRDAGGPLGGEQFVVPNNRGMVRMSFNPGTSLNGEIVLSPGVGSTSGTFDTRTRTYCDSRP